MLPREAPQPAQERLQDDLPGLRLSARPRVLPNLLICALAGLAYSTAFPPLSFGPAAFVALIPLLATVRRAGPARGALMGAVWGAAAFGAILSWLRLFGVAPLTLVTLLSAGFLAVYGAIAPAVWRDDAPIRSSAALAALWVLMEWFRGIWPLGGFTWGQVAASQVSDGPVTRVAPFGGGWAMSFLVVLVVTLAIVAWERWGSSNRRAALLTAAAVPCLILAPLALPTFAAEGRPIDVAAIQVDVRQYRALPWIDEDRAIAAYHAEIHRSLVSAPPDLIVWGEGALDPGASVDPTSMLRVSRAIRLVGAPTLVGAVTDDGRGTQQTAAILFGRDGIAVDTYAKVHLVPFGEYVPWRRYLTWFEAIQQIPVDRVPGPAPRTLAIDGLPPFGAPICFENAFPDIERGMVRDGATFLVVTINNASYEETAAAEQHLQMSQLRALETGRWIVHAAISGVSAVIAPDGKVTARLGLFRSGVTRATIRTSQAQTPYVRFGNWAVIASALGVVAAVLRPRRRRTALETLGGTLPARPRVLVLVPTYDEAATITEVLDRILATTVKPDVLVIDDGSPDGTAAIVRSHAAFDTRVRLLERAGKQGLASAYLQGFRRAMAEGYDLAVEMDADLSHAPEDLDRLVPAAADADLVIGSRYVAGGGVRDWSAGRLALSRAGNAYARRMLGLEVRDATAGYRVFRCSLLPTLIQPPPSADGYAFQVEMALRAADARARIVEVPIVFAERAEGRSKMSRRIVAEALRLVTLWGLRDRFAPRTPNPPSTPITDVMTS